MENKKNTRNLLGFLLDGRKKEKLTQFDSFSFNLVIKLWYILLRIRNQMLWVSSVFPSWLFFNAQRLRKISNYQAKSRQRSD
jgi:hypothetical protein